MSSLYTHVVLLRGVNVGKAKRVPMADFKKLLAKLGCDEVKTVLNSGNAVVSAKSASSEALADEVAAGLRRTFGFDVPVVVKSIRDFQAIVAANNLAAITEDHSRLLVAFAQSSTAIKGLSSIAELLRAPEKFIVGKEAAYLHCPDGILESVAAKALLGKVGQAITTRNWATVLKLHELCTADAGRIR